MSLEILVVSPCRSELARGLLCLLLFLDLCLEVLEELPTIRQDLFEKGLLIRREFLLVVRSALIVGNMLLP